MIKKFNRENTHTRQGSASIHITKAGQFIFSKKACHTLGLKENDCVQFAYDDAENKWYIAKCKNGFALKFKTDAFSFTCAQLKREIFTINKIETLSYSFKIKPEKLKVKEVGDECYELATENLP